MCAVLPSDLNRKKASRLKTVDADLNLTQLNELRSIAKQRGERLLVRYRFPYVISDAPEHAHVYEQLAGLWKCHIPKREDAYIIGLHVRRGELFLVDSDRMLPNSYYIEMARHAIKVCTKLGVAYRIELYSEVPRAKQRVHHFANGKAIDTPITLSPEDSALFDFDVFGSHLYRYLDEPCLDTFDRMVNCDLLVASRSSLSACASYLKKDGATLYHPFWHRMLASDIACDAPDLDERLSACVHRALLMRPDIRDGEPSE